MLEARDAGKCRAVGVSNFEASAPVVARRPSRPLGAKAPEVSQVANKRVVASNGGYIRNAFCRAEGIAVMGYCPPRPLQVTRQDRARSSAEELGQDGPAVRQCVGHCSAASITIGDKLESGARAPKAVFDFELDEEQMAQMDALDRLQGLKLRFDGHAVEAAA